MVQVLIESGYLLAFRLSLPDLIKRFWVFGSYGFMSGASGFACQDVRVSVGISSGSTFSTPPVNDFEAIEHALPESRPDPHLPPKEFISVCSPVELSRLVTVHLVSFRLLH